MSYFLTHCLKITEYFGTDDLVEFNYIGGLILRNLQFLQFNTHEVYELHEDTSSKTVFIGGGLYPTLALFNHSCDPSIVRYEYNNSIFYEHIKILFDKYFRYYKGTSVYVHAITNIKAGNVIAENYGPLYSQNPIQERKNTLKEQYWFDCMCHACIDNWPLYDEMNTKEIRFK